jgi:hypothetical protein
VVICDEQTSEIFAITHLDKVITVLVNESELQKLVAASAERAAPADRPRE